MGKPSCWSFLSLPFWVAAERTLPYCRPVRSRLETLSTLLQVIWPSARWPRDMVVNSRLVRPGGECEVFLKSRPAASHYAANLLQYGWLAGGYSVLPKPTYSVLANPVRRRADRVPKSGRDSVLGTLMPVPARLDSRLGEAEEAFSVVGGSINTHDVHISSRSRSVSSIPKDQEQNMSLHSTLLVVTRQEDGFPTTVGGASGCRWVEPRSPARR